MLARIEGRRECCWVSIAAERCEEEEVVENAAAARSVESWAANVRLKVAQLQKLLQRLIPPPAPSIDSPASKAPDFTSGRHSLSQEINQLHHHAMATSATSRQADYFASRPSPRSRPSASVIATAGSPGSPRTPLIGRSISGQLGSPGALSREPEEHVVYELHPRYLSAGFAGEGKPRCVHRFGLQTADARRVGDYREFMGGPKPPSSRRRSSDQWSANYEIFRAEVRKLDLALLSDRLERAVRTIHTTYLQLDTAKPRKAVLALPTLIPTPVLEIVLRVLFTHHAQPPTITLLTTPILSCIGAGLRSALVIDIGWEETVVTAVGEQKAVAERRSVRGGKMLVRETAGLLEEANGGKGVDFTLAEDVTRRMAWCRSRSQSDEDNTTVTIPPSESAFSLAIPFFKLANPAEATCFQPSTDDHDLPLPALMHQVLLALPVDLRAMCISRVVLTGSNSKLPGLKSRLLQELSQIVDRRGWDRVESYGSAKDPLPLRLLDRVANAPSEPPHDAANGIPARNKPHDDATDRLSQQISQVKLKNSEAVVKGVVRGVETLGAWSGASLVASLKVKGVVEVERDEFLTGNWWREKKFD
ncbi:hypothetical protein Q7P37_005530 [Cladosporium fusiforme]